MSERKRWFFLDEHHARAVCIPSLTGFAGVATVSLIDLTQRREIDSFDVAPGAVLELDLARCHRLIDYGLEVCAGRDTGSLQSVYGLSASRDDEVHTIRPSDWGVSDGCEVVVTDPVDRSVLVRKAVEVGSSCSVILRFTGGRKLQLSFESLGTTTGGERRMLPPIRLVPHAQRGRPAAGGTRAVSGLRVTTRSNVLLTPGERSSPGRGGLATYGSIGAWEGREPVVEAMDYVLGRQRYQFAPRPDRGDLGLPDELIYLGQPRDGWGHFLTQGLARVWYALERPDLPVLWDARQLLPYQAAVLELLGMRNQQHFLTRPSQSARVHFPDQGECLGDFVRPEFASAIGKIEPATIVPGKRLLVTRSRLQHERGAIASRRETFEEVGRRYGFISFAPEEHSVKTQLAELSSAEIVMGVEGSAFHSLLLLRGRPQTQFWALTRHRGGSGVFQHIKDAKRLHYETLNFLRARPSGASAEIDFDLESLEEVLRLTLGLTTNFGAVNPYLERPSKMQTTLTAHHANTQVRLSNFEREMARLARMVRDRDWRSAQEQVSGYF